MDIFPGIYYLFPWKYFQKYIHSQHYAPNVSLWVGNRSWSLLISSFFASSAHLHVVHRGDLLDSQSDLLTKTSATAHLCAIIHELRALCRWRRTSLSCREWVLTSGDSPCALSTGSGLSLSISFLTSTFFSNPISISSTVFSLTLQTNKFTRIRCVSVFTKINIYAKTRKLWL